MSHFTTYKLPGNIFTDLDTLCSAIEDCGYKPLRNTTARGYNGQSRQCDVVIGGLSLSYNTQAGFVKTKDGYDIICDNDAKRQLKGLVFGENDQINSGKLAQSYFRIQTIQTMQKQGFVLKNSTDETMRFENNRGQSHLMRLNIKTGEFEDEAQGFRDQSCEDASKAIEDAFGAKAKSTACTLRNTQGRARINQRGR